MLSVKKLEDHELEQEFGITWDGRYKTIEVLLKYKADVNFKEPVRITEHPHCISITSLQ